MTVVLEPAAARLYDALTPLAGDDRYGWLAGLCAAAAGPLVVGDRYGADTDAGVGWSALLDIDRCPPEALGWLAQLVGVTTQPGLPDDAQRARIRDASGWRRGTAASIVAAAQAWLVGSKHVELVERYGGDAYAIKVKVYDAEALDPDQLEAAIREAIPAGLILTVELVSGMSYLEFETAYAGTYATAETAWSGQTYADAERALP